jgi:hypothetical protein
MRRRVPPPTSCASSPTKSSRNGLSACCFRSELKSVPQLTGSVQRGQRGKLTRVAELELVWRDCGQRHLNLLTDPDVKQVICGR